MPVKRASLLVLFALSACTSAPQPAAPAPAAQAAQPVDAAQPAKPTSGQSCSELRGAALEQIKAAIEANRACRTDADCAAVSLGASCFDACTRPMSKAGQAALDAAVKAANDGPCAAFAKAACPAATPPPCPPAMAPSCKNGQCG